MSFEDSILRKVDRQRSQERRERLHELPRQTLEQAHVKAEQLLSNRDYSIQATDFIDLYGKQNVFNDMFMVKQRRVEFKKKETPETMEAKRNSDVFEAIMIQHTELSNWLGENVAVAKTSLYDDYFNGTDVIAEWRNDERESNVLALAVDITFGKASVERKLMHIRRDVESGRLGEIKYFRNFDGSFRGQRKGVPHAVIGVDKQSVEQLAQLWLRGDKKALAEHPIQRAIVDELYEQLSVIYGHALGRGQTKVADAYRRSLAIVEELRSKKMDVPLGSLEHDRVYGEIMSRSRSIFRA